MAMAMDKERSAALSAMDLVKITQAYVQQMVDEVQGGYKALLLDKETMRIVSTLYGRNELAEHSVVHVERLDAAAAAAASSSSDAGRDHLELKVCWCCFVVVGLVCVKAQRIELQLRALAFCSAALASSSSFFAVVD